MIRTRRLLTPRDQAAHFLRAGVIGWPIKHSLSPRLHSYWLDQYDINGSYEKMAVLPYELEKKLHELAKIGYSGVNITVPYKETVMGILDDIEPLAKRVGAVNTVIMRKNGKLVGRNTDVFGFHENLHAHQFRLNNGTVAILGAGGAARAAIVALLDMGAGHIRIVNRTLDRATQLAKEFGPRVSSHNWDEDNLYRDIRLLVNATPLGLKGQPRMKLSFDAIAPEATVTDMVYTPLRTDLLQRAQSNGNPIIDGLGMLLYQAKPAFKAFFGKDPEVTPELRQYVIAGINHD